MWQKVDDSVCRLDGWGFSVIVCGRTFYASCLAMARGRGNMSSGCPSENVNSDSRMNWLDFEANKMPPTLTTNIFTISCVYLIQQFETHTHLISSVFKSLLQNLHLNFWKIDFYVCLVEAYNHYLILAVTYNMSWINHGQRTVCQLVVSFNVASSFITAPATSNYIPWSCVSQRTILLMSVL